MGKRWRHFALWLMLCALASCAAPSNNRQLAAPSFDDVTQREKAIVVLAVDLREQTSLRDIARVGDIFFRRVDDRYRTRTMNDYDFAIKGSVGADWSAKLGGEDENRAPHLFALDPGTYVVEKINMGGGPTTIGAGYDPGSDKASFGVFSVRAGEVVNLGRLVVHMHWYEGLLYAHVEDDTSAIRQLVREKYPVLESKLETRLLAVAARFPFRVGGS